MQKVRDLKVENLVLLVVILYQPLNAEMVWAFLNLEVPLGKGSSQNNLNSALTSPAVCFTTCGW